MKETLTLAADTGGWLGAVCTAAAYALVSRRRFAPDSTAFQSLNLLGAALLAASAASSGAWPAVAANFVWILISVQALVGVRRLLGAAAERLGGCDESAGAPGPASTAPGAARSRREPAAASHPQPTSLGSEFAAWPPPAAVALDSRLAKSDI